MTRSNSVFMLRRAYERVVASLGALTVTALMLFSVNAQAAPLSSAADSVTPSVTILVPTVTIEVVDEGTGQRAGMSPVRTPGKAATMLRVSGIGVHRPETRSPFHPPAIQR